jgi:hypothetical protein
MAALLVAPVILAGNIAFNPKTTGCVHSCQKCNELIPQMLATLRPISSESCSSSRRLRVRFTCCVGCTGFTTNTHLCTNGKLPRHGARS